ncbi:MAG: hypothetical protein WEE66_10235 [Actinomycetota bacterium]
MFEQFDHQKAVHRGIAHRQPRRVGLDVRAVDRREVNANPSCIWMPRHVVRGLSAAARVQDYATESGYPGEQNLS